MGRGAWTCALCHRPADDALRLGTLTTHYAEVPLCNGHLAAFRLNDWWLTMKFLDTYASVSGHQLTDDDPAQGGAVR